MIDSRSLIEHFPRVTWSQSSPVTFGLLLARAENGIKRIVTHSGLYPAVNCQDISRKQGKLRTP